MYHKVIRILQKNIIRGSIGYKCLQNYLDAIIFLRESISSYRRGNGKPYRSREVAVEEQVSIVFDSAAGGAVVINVIGIPGSSFGSG
jgi:hypothetical protein